MWLSKQTCEPLWQGQAASSQPSPSPETEKEKEMIPGEFLDLTIKTGDNNSATFKVYRGEREKLDIRSPIQYENKMFENRMMFDCEGREQVVLFTNSVLCNPSFRNCEKSSLIVYESHIHADSFESSMMNHNIPKFYNLLFSNSHFTFDGCVYDETKEFVEGDRGGGVLFEFGPKGGDKEHCKEKKDQVETEYLFPFTDNYQTLKFRKGGNFQVFEMKEVDWKDMFDEDIEIVKPQEPVKDDNFQVFEMKEGDWKDMFDEDIEIVKPQDPDKAIPLGPDEELCFELYGNKCKRNKKTGVITILSPADGAWYEDGLKFVREEAE